jgi:heme/copper-type cytochrome/quinol oxidase subunit 4
MFFEYIILVLSYNTIPLAYTVMSANCFTQYLFFILYLLITIVLKLILMKHEDRCTERRISVCTSLFVHIILRVYLSVSRGIKFTDNNKQNLFKKCNLTYARVSLFLLN